ncbi:hypothetical protein BaRGS_00004265 [Batillaria attramentaria]|uniref:Uncharacterized protein n=1 Tax=Batillaria attramentaria TaxID=370345 RepID=A0ABD0LZF2_9CAEN
MASQRGETRRYRSSGCVLLGPYRPKRLMVARRSLRQESGRDESVRLSKMNRGGSTDPCPSPLPMTNGCLPPNLVAGNVCDQSTV